MPVQRSAPRFDPKKISSRHCSKKKLDIFIFLKSFFLRFEIIFDFELQNLILVDLL